jgi:transcriptional regulator with XRE-family HTH domain
MQKIPKLQKAFAYVLRYHREMAKLTQPQLAKKIGGSEINIRTLERGVTAPSLTTFLLIADALGIGAQQLLSEVQSRMATMDD